MWTIPILHGPNLNLIGVRETAIYGEEDFDTYLLKLKKGFQMFDLHYHQSNTEGQIVDWIQEYRLRAHAILINPAAYTHTSIAIRDAIALCAIPVIEIHISAVKYREDFRHKSLIKDLCLFNIQGSGLNGYRYALLRLAEYFNSDSKNFDLN